MTEHDPLAKRFQDSRPHLQGVAFRMLGTLSEAEDAVQEAWLRVSRADTREVENLNGWLTTVVARVCLDMLRSRKARREDAVGAELPEPVALREAPVDPETEAVLADSIGLALLVVLETLPPPERLAFVLHDLFAMPFEEIGPIVGRTPTATRQLASRARRRVQGADTERDPNLDQQRAVIDAFLTASRGGDMDKLLSLLDPDAVVRADSRVGNTGKATEYRGAALIAKRVSQTGARGARLALVNGAVGAVVAPRGRLLLVLRYTVTNGKIALIEAIAEPDRLAQLELALLD